ncbi:hypothetical protein [Aliiroseovarius sp. S253]|uniref:hypothetical protein n=1 Tax=Aliiroseovarius sp. S253 TaxID=3415133 RepID=UPI003C797EBE
MVLSKFKRVATAILVLQASAQMVHAHQSPEHNGQHGGPIVATQHNHVELVRLDNEVAVYLYDLDLTPRSAENITIEATLVDGTSQTQFDLVFTPPNKFSAKGIAASASATIVLRLFRDGDFWDLTRLK